MPDWYADPNLSWGARGLLWHICRGDPARIVTAEQLAAEAARQRPGHAEPPALIAEWLTELAQARALVSDGRRYRIPADREADIMAAKLAGEHIRLSDPALTRAEARQWQGLIRELVLSAGHDPADVSLALSRWRERRRAGQRLGRDTLLAILGDIELEAAEGQPEYATVCPHCLNPHPPTSACLHWRGPGR